MTASPVDLDALAERHERYLASKRPPEKQRPVRADHGAVFLEYHTANPHIYAEFERRALELAEAGATRIAVAKIREEIRADISIRTISDDYKLSNTFTPDYARLLVQAHPETLGKLIQINTRKSV